MKCLDLTLPAAAANLALDEALLDACENEAGAEVLRYWESHDYFVVVGYANHVATEVNVPACKRDGIAIHRRCSGGGTVLQGPGCLNYSLALRIEGNEALHTITAANRHIMNRHREIMSALLGRPVAVQGHTDLALDGLKFSGNAQRRQRQALLFHGTFLLNFDLSRIAQYLLMPSREPDYRQGRPHESFLTNLPLATESVKAALKKCWSAEKTLEVVPDCQQLISAKYSRDDWNLKF